MNRINKVLVTGADGFIGSHLVELLLKEGFSVRALSYYNSFNRWGWLDGIKNPQLEVVSGDVRDAGFCRSITNGIDVIYHLAALIAIPYSYIAPESYVDTNVKGTLNICQAACDNKCHRVMITSTSEVYGTAKYVPIDELHPRQAQSPYSATKIAADAIALSYYNAFELPVTIVRPFNTYGPRQSARAIIPTIITQIANGIREIKLGDLTPTRDFNYVKDTVRGFLELSNSEEAIGQEVNLCGGNEISMRDTLMLIARLMGENVSFLEDKQRIRPAGSEVFRLKGDNAKLKRMTGFLPEYSLEAGLRETIEWFSVPENLRNYKSGLYNV